MQVLFNQQVDREERCVQLRGGDARAPMWAAADREHPGRQE